MTAPEKFVEQFWLGKGRAVLNVTEMAEMCEAYAASQTAAKEAEKESWRISYETHWKALQESQYKLRTVEERADRAERALRDVPIESLVKDLRAHYNTDWDGTVPGKLFDAEIERIVRKWLSPVPEPLPPKLTCLCGPFAVNVHRDCPRHSTGFEEGEPAVKQPRGEKK